MHKNWLRNGKMRPNSQRSYQNTPGPRRDVPDSTPRSGRDGQQFVYDDQYLGDEFVDDQQTPRREHNPFNLGAIPKFGPRYEQQEFDRNFPRRDQPRQDRFRQDQFRQNLHRNDQYRQDQSRHDQTRNDQSRHDQTRHDQSRHDQTRPDQARHDQQSRHDQTGLNQPGQDQHRPEQLRPEQPGPDLHRQDPPGFDQTFQREEAEVGPRADQDRDPTPEVGEEVPLQAGMAPGLEPNGGEGDNGSNEQYEEGEEDRYDDRGMEAPRGLQEGLADEGDLLLIFRLVFYYIQVFFSSQNLLLAIIVLFLTLSLTGTSVWMKYSQIYWSSPWMYNWTCVGGLVVCFIIYLNKMCLYFWNRNVFSSMYKLLSYPVRNLLFRSRPRTSYSGRPLQSRPITSHSDRPLQSDETYVVNGGNVSNQSQSSSGSQRSSPNYPSRQPSGGWNGGNPYTSTPAPPSSRGNLRQNQSRYNSSNFRPDSRFASLGAESPHINIREDQNTYVNPEISHYNSLDPADKTIIDTLSP